MVPIKLKLFPIRFLVIFYVIDSVKLLKFSITMMLWFTHYYLYLFSKAAASKHRDFHTVNRIYMFNWRCMYSQMIRCHAFSMLLVTLWSLNQIWSGLMVCLPSSPISKINKEMENCVHINKRQRGRANQWTTFPLHELYCAVSNERKQI